MANNTTTGTVSGLTRAQARALAAACSRGAWRADNSQRPTDAAAFSRTINSLVSRGLVEPIRDRHGFRSEGYRATPAGRAALAQYEKEGAK
jgi:DNA-binding MarR family transcriptional regulator